MVIPGLGTFTYIHKKTEVGNKGVKSTRTPVFVVADAFCQANDVKKDAFANLTSMIYKKTGERGECRGESVRGERGKQNKKSSDELTFIFLFFYSCLHFTASVPTLTLNHSLIASQSETNRYLPQEEKIRKKEGRKEKEEVDHQARPFTYVLYLLIFFSFSFKGCCHGLSQRGRKEPRRSSP